MGAVTFATYLDSLVGSWRALAAPHPDAEVIEANGFVAARFPSHPVLDNAVLFDADRLAAACAVYPGVEGYAVWSASQQVGQALAEAGFRRQEITAAMVCRLPLSGELGFDRRSGRGENPVEVWRVDSGLIAALNGVSDDLLRGVPGARAYATADGAAGALLIEVGSDVNVSFVATRPERRQAGLATAVLRHALGEAARTGARTASLQATAMATGLYRRLGFDQVGQWQEWTRE